MGEEGSGHAVPSEGSVIRSDGEGGRERDVHRTSMHDGMPAATVGNGAPSPSGGEVPHGGDTLRAAVESCLRSNAETQAVVRELVQVIAASTHATLQLLSALLTMDGEDGEEVDRSTATTDAQGRKIIRTMDGMEIPVGWSRDDVGPGR